MLSGAREAGCYREVAALHSDHLRQVPLYVVLADEHVARGSKSEVDGVTASICSVRAVVFVSW